MAVSYRLEVTVVLAKIEEADLEANKAAQGVAMWRSEFVGAGATPADAYLDVQVKGLDDTLQRLQDRKVWR